MAWKIVFLFLFLEYKRCVCVFKANKDFFILVQQSMNPQCMVFQRAQHSLTTRATF